MNKNSSIYKAIILEFGSISHAGRKLGFTRKAIYDFIEADSLSIRAINKITEAGYDSATFKYIQHGKKENV